MNIFLLYFSFLYNGNWQKISEALSQKQKISTPKLISTISKNSCPYLTILDKSYPESIKSGPKPPFVIFYQGNINLLKCFRFLAIYSSLLTSNLLKLITKSLSELDANDCIVLDGLGLFEKKMLEVALAKNAKVIIVAKTDIKTAFNEIKSLLNDKKMDNILLISELPSNTKNVAYDEKQSLRIVASISDKLILYSTNNQKKLNFLTDFFTSQGKEIFAFPNFENENSNLNNELINAGIKIATSLKNC